MSTSIIRETLQRQLEILPDELIQKIADFTAFILIRRRQPVVYADWQQGEWSDFALQNMLRETNNDIEYSLADAQEIYKSYQPNLEKPKALTQRRGDAKPQKLPI